MWRNFRSWLVLRITPLLFINPTNAGSGVPGAVYPYSAAEVRTQTVNYGYGCYSLCVRPARTSGVVTSFYVYSNGLWDSPWRTENYTVPHREIDIEFLVKDGRVVMQSNVFNDPPRNHPNSGWEEIHDIPIDASRNFGVYGFKWTEDAIEWWVEGRLVRTMRHSASTQIPKATDSTMRLMANVYSVTPENGGAEWAGTVPGGFRIDAAVIKWLRFQPGRCNVIKHCRFAQ